MTIEHTFNPSIENIHFLTSKLNEAAEGFQSVYPFGFFIKDASKQIKAGVNGCIMYGVIYVDQLWVDVDYRKRGLGRQLMEQAHLLGQKEGCSMATVCTMSFLGVEKFYESLGYKVDFVRLGYANGSSCIFLSKKLASISL
ncbi:MULTISPECIES: N-acetyltransferase [unclassified Candidatus Cardinium]|uniref:GNAT family N-acetyltransferase n=1 Tax=unclassified Candidatus Cardinium TaxID=2641185 RepID=UPI001FB49C2B|nr:MULTISPECIES: GNAT family N-acetyltransferase [unclassified Candidatus Cardinium]